MSRLLAAQFAAQAGLAGVDYARQIDWHLRREHPQLATENSSDRAVSRARRRLGLSSRPGPVRLVGRVAESLPSFRWYKVVPDARLPAIRCCLGALGASGLLGARSLAQLPPYTPVLVDWFDELGYGVIVAALPESAHNPLDNYGDFVSLFSRGGLAADAAYTLPLLADGLAGGVLDWSSGGPRDALGAGESGCMAETGVGTFVDSHMAYLRADEDTGVWAFRDDGLLRAAGRNLQLRSRAYLFSACDDQGEPSVETEQFHSAWERLGGWLPGQAVARELPPAEAPQLGRPPLSPLYDDQQPFARAQSYGGFLGGLGRRQGCLPPQPFPSTPNRFGVDLVYPGVFAEQVTPTGQATLASAMGITLTKRLCLPVPKRRTPAESPRGDNPANYRHVGVLGAGPAQPVRAGLRLDDPDEDVELEAASEVDRQAYTFAWENLLPFRAHRLDFFTPEEQEVGCFGSSQQQPPDFAALADRPFLPAPPPYAAWVDERYGNVGYYPNSSYLSLTPRGNVLLRDGCFAGVRMVGGNLILEAPGDIVLRSGRSTIVLAGKDGIIRARDAVDVSATQGAIRARAARELKLKGYGVEVYSPVAITCKSGHSTRIWSRDIYLRAGVGGVADNGAIHLDAARGAGAVTVHAKTIERYVHEGAFDYFLDASGYNLYRINAHTAEGSDFHGNVYVGSCLAVADTVFVGEWIVSVNQHVVTKRAAEFGNRVETLADEDFDDATALLADALQSLQDMALSGDTAYAAQYRDCLYADKGEGDDLTIRDARFLYRSVEEYGTTNFVMYESPWQQQARIQGADVSAWVEVDEEDTYPYPGKEAIEGDTYRLYNPQLYDPETGRTDPVAGNDAYTDPLAPPADRVALNDNYFVITFPGLD